MAGKTETDKRNESFMSNLGSSAGKALKAAGTGLAKAALAPGKAIAGAIEGKKDEKVKAKADEIAAENAGKTAAQADIITHDLYDPQGNLVAKKGDPKGTDRRNQTAKAADEASKAQAAAKLDERFGTQEAVKEATTNAPTTNAPTTNARTNLTFDDVLKETGGDPQKVRDWLASHPGYTPGAKTNAWLEANPVKEQPTEKAEEQLVGPVEEVSNKAATKAVETSETPNEAADKVAESIGADKEQKKQIEQAAKSIWSAIADGSMSKEAGGYFLMDAIQKAANNRQRRDSNYIENLSRAAHGDTILGYDVSNDEKSKYETMVQDPALERANKAAGIESESNAQTAADLSTANQQAEYGEAVGTQGLAQTAAVQQALNGNFDAMANAVANGSPEEVQGMLDAALKDPQLDTTIKSLQAQLQQGTLDADIKAAELANSLTTQQLALMQSQAKLLGIEGNLKGAMAGAINNLASGNIDMQSIMLLMMMKYFGVM